MENEIVSLSPGFHTLLVIKISLKEWLCLQESVYLEDFQIGFYFLYSLDFITRNGISFEALFCFIKKNLLKILEAISKKNKARVLSNYKTSKKNRNMRIGIFVSKLLYYPAVIFHQIECFNFQMAFYIRK